MKALVKKLQLDHLAQDIDFAFTLQDSKNQSRIRRGRLDDVLFNSKIGFRAKLSLLWFGLSVLLRGGKLGHGNTTNIAHLDDQSVEEYFQRIGGNDILDHFLYPGLNGPLGGNLRKNSRLILFQTFWNILLMKTWAIKGGMDHIVNAMAKQLNVRTKASVDNVKIENESLVTVTVNGERINCERCIIALPGNIAAQLCPDLPEHVLKLLRETKFGEMVSAHVMMNKATLNKTAAFGIAREVDDGYEMEIEHNRVKELCAEGKGLVSIYMWPEEKYRINEKSDDEIKMRAAEIVKKHFPECANDITGTHVLRWKEGICHFAPGRLTQMSALRQEMKTWKLPIQLAGDYLDGIASESALVTGEEAADNLVMH
jgi:predicted NAD/FAD-dependent oxidoreductase